MKIVYINTCYYPNMVGGTEVSLKKLAEGMVNRGHEVVVICCSDKNDEKVINGVKVYYLQSEIKNVFARNLFEFNNNNLVRKTIKIIRTFMPHIVHTNNIFPFSPVIWKKINNMNIPIIHTTRDYYLIGSRNIIKRKYLIRMTKYVSFVTAASDYTLKKHLISNCFIETPKEVVVNATDFDYSAMTLIKEEKLKTKKTYVDFAFIGRLTEEKGIVDLLDTFVNYNSKNVLHVFGKGEKELLVKEYAQTHSNIIFEGFLDEQELNKKLRKIDIVIVPTTNRFQEPFGRVVLDAYKQMIPVIACRVGGLPEVVSEHKTGLLIEPSSKQELIKAMQWFESRDNITNTFSEIEIKTKEYLLDTQLDNFLKIYNRLIH